MKRDAEDSRLVKAPGRRLFAIGVLALALSEGAGAQPLWGEIALPGGGAAARRLFALGDERRDDASVLLDFIGSYYSASGNESGVAQTFRRYVAYVDALDKMLKFWPEGLQLPPKSPQRNERDRWRDLCEQLGLRLREVRDRPVVEADNGSDAQLRASWARALGIDPAAVASQLNGGQRVHLVVPQGVLPLPLPAVWPQILRDRPEESLVARLLTSRSAALLYVALVALDEETLGFFAARPEYLRRLSEEETAVFAAFGRSLHIRNASVMTPGQPADAAVWESLVDERVADAEAFVRRWLRRDHGRLAHFYDAVMRLPARHREWLLMGGGDDRDRARIMRRLYDRFAPVESDWRVSVRPFYRPVDDPAQLLSILDVAPDGTIAPAWWPPLLERITNGGEWPNDTAKRLTAQPATAEWLLDWLYEHPQQTPHRFKLLRFGQRRFRTVDETAVSSVEIALRGAFRMPALLIALERIGLRTPEVYAVVVQSARTLTTAANPERIEPAVIRFQAALSLIEQITRRRELPTAMVEEVCRQLAATVTKRANETGATAVWLFESLLPALEVDAGAVSSEAAFLAALLPRDTAAEVVTWEGLQYRVDRNGPVVRDAIAVRSAARTATVMELAALHTIRRKLERPSQRPEEAQAIGAELRILEKNLAASKVGDRVLPEVRALEGVARTLTRAKTPRDASRAGRQAPAVIEAIDAVTSIVLPSIVYALAVAPTHQPRVYTDIATRHTLWVKDEDVEWRNAVWAVARTDTQPGGGLRVRGSLLTLDVPLAESQTRVVPGGGPPGAPSFNLTDYNAYLARLVLRTGGDPGQSTAVIDALHAGRARLLRGAGAAAETTLVATLRAAGVSQTRVNVMMWSSNRGNSRALGDQLSPRELVHIGAPEDLPPYLWVSSLPFEGCPCLSAATRRPVEELSTYPTSGVMVRELLDLQIRLIEVLQEIGLPPKLMEALLPLAVTEALGSIFQMHAGDWAALRVSSLLTRDRVEEYLLALVADGILAAPK